MSVNNGIVALSKYWEGPLLAQPMACVWSGATCNKLLSGKLEEMLEALETIIIPAISFGGALMTADWCT